MAGGPQFRLAKLTDSFKVYRLSGGCDLVSVVVNLCARPQCRGGHTSYIFHSQLMVTKALKRDMQVC